MRRLAACVLAAAACSSPGPRTDVHPPPPPPPPPHSSEPVVLDGLVENQHAHGYTVTALYLDDADKPIGARFVHDSTKFVLDYLRIESAPQGFLWVNSFPTSDKGEPHTQEHLLLGKGDRGRRFGSMQAMALAESSAFTAQWRTAYHFHTVAGHDVFWPVLENQIDAMLYPDYTDEEIRREVRNFGVDKGDDGKLRLEEKGTVYNEMVRTYEQPEAALYRTVGQLLYGAQHPLSYESGGYPDAIRDMTPADIRAFHQASYHLDNMGMIGAFPSSMALADVLDRTAALLELEAKKGGASPRAPMTEATLPKPRPAATGTIQIVDYPSADTTSPGPVMFAWPANRTLSDVDRMLLSLFVDALAGDESTPLYKKLVDGKTRVLDLGASGLGAFVSSDLGHPVYLGVSGVKSAKLDRATVEQVRGIVLAEIQRIANLPDGDPELVAFDQRVASRVVDRRRKLTKFLDTPPGFGIRGTTQGWMDLLHDLEAEPRFRRSLTMRPALAKVADIVAAPANPWRDRLKAWGLLDTPVGVAARPSPQLRADLDAARGKRNADELARLAGKYGSTDTLAAYARAYDAETAKIEAASRAVPLPPLVDSLPMTFDDELHYRVTEVYGSVPLVETTFDTMASARVEIAAPLDAVDGKDLFYLALLPVLLTDVGVLGGPDDGRSGTIEDGKALTAGEVRERLRKEVLEVSAHYVESPRTRRHEIVFAAAGNDAGETKAALAWLRRMMWSADWRKENLPRLRDVVEQSITGLRQAMQGAEEDWVTDPRDAWWRQDDAVHLHTASFLTRLYDLHRLRWMLMDPGDARAREAGAKWLEQLAEAGKLKRGELIALTNTLADPAQKSPPSVRRWLEAAKGLPKPAAHLAVDAGKDLSALLSDLPDGSLAADWRALCVEMASDLRAGADTALEGLARVKQRALVRTGARGVAVGSTAHLAAIHDDVAKLVDRLEHHELARGSRPTGDAIAERLRAREPRAQAPTYVGLVAPSTSSGVFLNTAPAPGYRATSDADVLDYLASNLYTGHGAHSMFMKTWAAGLAYSNGIHPQPHADRIEYYAERCPLLPQTLRFVIEQLRAVTPDANIARYAVAGAFPSRVASGYEQRASAMASNLADGMTPDVVRAFRTKVLALAKRDDLAKALYDRLPAVYGKILPGGFGPLPPGAVSFVIGPDKQLAAYEDYLHAAVGKDATLYRLYPRDFWIVN